MPDRLAVKLIPDNTRREEARDEKKKCPFLRYGSSTFLCQKVESNPRDLA
jgi:hypothetical protein